jgi:hypothetical protein
MDGPHGVDELAALADPLLEQVGPTRRRRHADVGDAEVGRALLDRGIEGPAVRDARHDVKLRCVTQDARHRLATKYSSSATTMRMGMGRA